MELYNLLTTFNFNIFSNSGSNCIRREFSLFFLEAYQLEALKTNVYHEKYSILGEPYKLKQPMLNTFEKWHLVIYFLTFYTVLQIEITYYLALTV